MSTHRSFRPSDFSLRDIPGFLAGYVLISIVFVVCGSLIDALPLTSFGRGVLLGLGLGFLGAIVLLRNKKATDLASLPEPSETVRAKCDDPACTFPSPQFVQAVKAYRDETGASLTEATEMLKEYVEMQRSQH